MTIYESIWCSDQGAMLTHSVFNDTCANFSSSDNWAVGSTCICTDGIMIKFATDTWAKYEG